MKGKNRYISNAVDQIHKDCTYAQSTYHIATKGYHDNYEVNMPIIDYSQRCDICSYCICDQATKIIHISTKITNFLSIIIY